MLIICRCFIHLLLFLSLYRKRFRLLKARPEIESLNSVGNLIKRRLSSVYLGVCMCVFFFNPPLPDLPSTKGSESIEEGGCPWMFCKSFYVWRQNLTKNTFNAFIYGPVVSINKKCAEFFFN